MPINSEHTIADLIHALGLPALLVVANRLGCLNHALLSVEALQSRGIEVAGWILNEPGPHDPDDVARNENHHELQRLIQAPCLGRLPYIAELHALPLPKFAQLAGEHLSPALKLITGEK